MKDIKNIIYYFGSKLIKRNSDRNNAEGFPSYLTESARLKMDVNDYIEQQKKWLPALPILSEIVFPLVDSLENPVVMELGVGTGRWSRHLINKINERGRYGQLYLVDHSQWIVDFLKGYFKQYPNMKPFKCNGVDLPFNDHPLFDLIFSQGTFIELKLGQVYLYIKEFSRLIKPGGLCVLDFIDPSSEGGWDYLKAQSSKYANCYTYHTFDTMDKVFKSAGFKFVNKYIIGKSTYVVYKKDAA